MAKSTSEQKEREVFFFCNPEQKDLMARGIKMICDQAYFEKDENRIIEELESVVGIIILLELNWQNRYFTDLEGFQLINKLKVKYNVQAPIIVTSNYPDVSKEGFAHHSNFHRSGFRYFQDASIKFISLPDLIKMNKKDIMESFEPSIEDALLQLDMIENLYNKEGYLLSFFNDLSSFNHNINTPVTKKEYWDSIKAKIHSLNNIIIGSDIESIARKQLDSLFDKEDMELGDENLNKFFIRFKDNIFQYYEKKNHPSDLFPPEEVKVLYINSNTFRDADVKKKLADYGIDCRVVHNGDDAVKTLKKLDIRVIISDFRFYDQAGKISREQGYHIVNKIYRMLPNLYYSIVLTNLDVPAISSFYNYTANQIYLKLDDLLRSRVLFSRFVQTIFNKDDNVRQQKELLPDFGKAMPLYLRHTQRNDYLEAESQIDKFALKFIEKIINGKPLKPLDNPGGSLDRKKEEDNIFNFRTKLKARRIALGICQLPASKLGYYRDKEELWYIIYSYIVTGQADKYSKGTHTTFISRHLFKMRTNISYAWNMANELRLTPREKSWLLRHGKYLEQGAIQ